MVIQMADRSRPALSPNSTQSESDHHLAPTTHPADLACASYNAWFYINTNAGPPRSQWLHPADHHDQNNPPNGGVNWDARYPAQGGDRGTPGGGYGGAPAGGYGGGGYGGPEPQQQYGGGYPPQAPQAPQAPQKSGTSLSLICNCELNRG